MVDPENQTPSSAAKEMSAAEQAAISRDWKESLAAAKSADEKRELVTAAFMLGEIGVDELEDYLQMFGVAEAAARKRGKTATDRALGRRMITFRVGGQDWLST
jgi:hypothetical protein